MKKKYKNIKLVVYKKDSHKKTHKQKSKNYSRNDLVGLFNAQMIAYNSTRQLQWRYNVSIWAVLIILTFLKYLHPNVFNPYFAGILFITALSGHYILIYLIQRDLASSKKIMDTYVNHLNNFNKSKDISINNNKYNRMYVLGITDYVWFAIQLIITCFLLLVFLQL